MFYYVFFFNDTATTEIYTLSLHDALPISTRARQVELRCARRHVRLRRRRPRSEEHTSELQSRRDLVCRLLLEKKKKKTFFFYFVLKPKVHVHTILSPSTFTHSLKPTYYLL